VDSSPKRSSPLHPLYVICDADACQQAGWSLVDFATAVVDAGARLLQVRAKGAAAGWLFDQTMTIVERARAAGALVIVNDRADVAVMTGAAGVHVGQEDLPPAAARRVVGPSAVLGFSTHTAAQVTAALAEPVSYLAIGPIFATATKDTGYGPVGLEGVRATVAATAGRVPVVAIGGITLDSAASVLDAGAQAVAVIGDLFVGGSPAARVHAFLHALSRV
jgi:thiamine-phosphate pyrophosphorylase